MKLSSIYFIAGSVIVMGFVNPLSSAQAQESTASSPIGLTETWGALSSQVSAAAMKTTSVNMRLDQIVVCNKLSKLYAPGPGADANGCIDNSKIVALQAKIDAITPQITTMNTQITTFNTKFTDLTTQITAIQGTVDGLNSKISGLTSLSSDLMTKASDAITQLNSITAQMNAITTQINSLNITSNTHAAQINDIYNRITALNTQINNLNASIASVNNTLNTVSGMASNLTGSINAVMTCGASNMIYNSNVGCVRPSGHLSCSIYVATTKAGSVSCGSPYYSDSYVSGSKQGLCGGGGSPNGSGYNCTISTYSTRCWAISC